MPSSTPAERVLVTFRTTTDGASLHIDGPSLDASERECSKSCTLLVQPGSYNVDVSVSGKTTKSFTVAVRERSEVVVSAGSPVARGLGIGLVVVGGLAALAGYVGGSSDPQNSNSESPGVKGALIITGLVGVGAVIGGLVLFVNSKPTVEVLPAPAESEHGRGAAPRLSRFGFVPTITPQGAALRVGLKF